jgi:hypothetical protein
MNLSVLIWRPGSFWPFLCGIFPWIRARSCPVWFGDHLCPCSDSFRLSILKSASLAWIADLSKEIFEALSSLTGDPIFRIFAFDSRRSGNEAFVEGRETDVKAYWSQTWAKRETGENPVRSRRCHPFLPAGEPSQPSMRHCCDASQWEGRCEGGRARRPANQPFGARSWR